VGVTSGVGRAADVFNSPIFAAMTSSRFSVAPETSMLVRSVALTPTPTLPLSGGGSATSAFTRVFDALCSVAPRATYVNSTVSGLYE
jgi:hypothetical protein